jgi:hypothetical protein
VIGLPPLLAGADQLTVADPLPPTADTPVGAPGATAACGTTAFDAAEAGPVPTAFVAVTVNVYVVPFTNPVTFADVGGGDPDTTVVAWATVPTYGVTV